LNQKNHTTEEPTLQDESRQIQVPAEDERQIETAQEIQPELDPLTRTQNERAEAESQQAARAARRRAGEILSEADIHAEEIYVMTYRPALSSNYRAIVAKVAAKEAVEQMAIEMCAEFGIDRNSTFEQIFTASRESHRRCRRYADYMRPVIHYRCHHCENGEASGDRGTYRYRGRTYHLHERPWDFPDTHQTTLENSNSPS
jgi:hypothetical protein